MKATSRRITRSEAEYLNSITPLTQREPDYPFPFELEEFGDDNPQWDKVLDYLTQSSCLSYLTAAGYIEQLTTAAQFVPQMGPFKTSMGTLAFGLFTADPSVPVMALAPNDAPNEVDFFMFKKAA